MKTIRELADELGVSKVAVQKKIDKLKIRNKLVIDGNRLLIPEELESTIKSTFTKSTDNRAETDRKENQQQNDNVMQTILEVLQKELEEKNRQIESLQTIINQEQQLRMITEQKLLALEQKDTESGEPDKVKPGFWGWLFGGKKKEEESTATPPEDQGKDKDRDQEGKV